MTRTKPESSRAYHRGAPCHGTAKGWEVPPPLAPDPGDPDPHPGDLDPDLGDPGPGDPGLGDPGLGLGDLGSEEEENFYASVLAAPSGRSSAKPWLSSASSRPLAAWHSSAKQRRD